MNIAPQRRRAHRERREYPDSFVPRSLRFCGELLILLVLTLGWANVVPAFGGEIDRLLVAVNGRAITEGDLVLARSLNEIVFYDKTADPSSREEEIGKLVDRELMKQELKNFSLTQEDESRVEARLRSLRELYAEKGGLPLLMRQLGLQESELISYLQLESSILKFVDFRFRPFVSISEEEIAKYYETRLIPQLQKAKLEIPARAQVSTRIEEILKEEKVNALLDQWIKEIRQNSRIEYFDEPGDSGISAESLEP
jgi:hypothetical protein